ncbi:Hypothetical protein Tcol_2091 [Trichococcus collinsii]|uniref:IrrE N-terminal-like domain-containing protein n=1 Tax=Trichococcus collinsii TaxID=157076 RepID=A0AB37ZXH7_9LACT|nr:Hypothetical protein Tcol_2091 [Trichococcus collinsii]SDZ97195.1 hypothetical protein SAMN04488525_101755 [Trichococcus collinsii]
MLRIREKLGKLGIKLEFIEMESKGCFINDLETMFVNSALSEDEMKMVIYHEMKHALDHADYAFLYKEPIYLIKMESEANEYMVRKIIEDNGGVYNYTQVIEEFKIGMGSDIRFAK